MKLMIVLLLLVFLSALLLNEWYRHTNAFRNQFVDVRKYWNGNVICEDTKILNLGSNHPKFAFDYSEADVKGVNCAVGPQTLEYDYAILRSITKNVGYKGCVVIPICLLKMFLYRQESRNIHCKYYTFLPSSDIVGYSRKEKIKNLYFPLLFHPWMVVRLIKDVKKDNRLELDSNPLTNEGELNEDADMWIDCWNKEFGIQLPRPELSQKNRDDIQSNICVLGEMLEYCSSRGMSPVLAILPVTENLSSRFTDDFIQEHIMAYLNKANTVGAPIMNYLRDSRFTSPELYINSFFMNGIGRKLFTKTFIEDLKTRKLI